MCVTLSPAMLSNTILFTGEAVRGNQIVHVQAYQNRVQNGTQPIADFDVNPLLRQFFATHSRIPDRTEREQAPGNAMILPFPAQPGTMSRNNVVSTENSRHFMDEMATSLRPVFRGGSSLLSYSTKRVDVFEHGIYTIVLAHDISALPAALEQVPEEKRPDLLPEMFDAYDRLYHNWTIALCCFNNMDAKKSSPMLWWYDPLNTDVLFAPALDAHDGRIPNLDEEVAVDHTVIFGSQLATTGKPIHFEKPIDHTVRQLLPDYIVGREYAERMPNGDFFARVEDVRAGMTNIERIAPSYIPASDS